MNSSISDELINIGINFGLIVFFFGTVYGIVCCMFKCSQTHDPDNSNDDHVIITIIEHAGVKPSVLQSIPVVDFNPHDLKNDDAECVVCLSDLVDGDKARVLPVCDHWFHAACIDKWFQTHSTCPICRKRVVGSVQRGTRPDDDDKSCFEHHGNPSTNPSSSTDVAVVEHVNCGEAGEV